MKMTKRILTISLLLLVVLGSQAQEYQLGQIVTNPDGSQGVVFYVNEDGTFGWMVALHDAALNIPWGPTGEIEGLGHVIDEHNDILTSAFADTNGYANTLAIRNHYQNTGNTALYAAGTVDIANGWYLPAAGQLKMLYTNAIFYEPALASVGETLGLHPYWSSTQESNDKAWFVHFGAPYPEEHWASNAFIRTATKTSNSIYYGEVCAVRAVRNIDFSDPPQPTPPPQPIPDTVYSEFSFHACNSYTWNDITYSESGDYQQTFTGAQDCDSIVTLHLTINTGVEVGEIQGPTHIFSNTFDDFTYSIDTVPDAFGYEWHIDNNWHLTTSPNSPQCIVGIYTKDKATLTVRVYSECGVTERSLLIRHDLEPGLTVFPNPNDGDFNISLYGLEGETVVEVYNYLGQLIDRFYVYPTVTGHTFSYSLRGKACGMYYISITNNHRHYTKKVVKKTGADYGVWSWY